MSENRINSRSLCSDLVKLEWKDAEGWMHELPAVLEDISARGASLQVETPVPINTEVQISHGEHWGITCRTIYCEFHEIGYYIGLEFPPGAFWSMGAFKPQHLLDLKQLIDGLGANAN